MDDKQRKIDLSSEGTDANDDVLTSGKSDLDQSCSPITIPFGPLKTPNEIAEAAVFLASDEHDLTGAVLVPDDDNTPKA